MLLFLHVFGSQDISAAFASLDVVYARLREFYMHQLENISVAVAGGGSNFSVVLTRGGSAWAFGSGEDGRTCQMHDVWFVFVLRLLFV